MDQNVEKPSFTFVKRNIHDQNIEITLHVHVAAQHEQSKPTVPVLPVNK